MPNWEDELLAEQEEPKEEETPIFTALYLEYREAAFRRIAADLEALKAKREQEETAPGEEGTGKA